MSEVYSPMLSVTCHLFCNIHSFIWHVPSPSISPVLPCHPQSSVLQSSILYCTVLLPPSSVCTEPSSSPRSSVLGAGSSGGSVGLQPRPREELTLALLRCPQMSSNVLKCPQMSSNVFSPQRQQRLASHFGKRGSWKNYCLCREL